MLTSLYTVNIFATELFFVQAVKHVTIQIFLQSWTCVISILYNTTILNGINEGSSQNTITGYATLQCSCQSEMSHEYEYIETMAESIYSKLQRMLLLIEKSNNRLLKAISILIN